MNSLTQIPQPSARIFVEFLYSYSKSGGLHNAHINSQPAQPLGFDEYNIVVHKPYFTDIRMRFGEQ